MSSQSTASAFGTESSASRRPRVVTANTRGTSPESLWVQSTPRCECETASPDSSVASGVATSPVICARRRPQSTGRAELRAGAAAESARPSLAVAARRERKRARHEQAGGSEGQSHAHQWWRIAGGLVSTGA